MFSAALSWLRARYPEAAIPVLMFCCEGNAAFLAAMLPGVAQIYDSYGVGVSRMSLCGVLPSLSLFS